MLVIVKWLQAIPLAHWKWLGFFGMHIFSFLFHCLNVPIIICQLFCNHSHLWRGILNRFLCFFIISRWAGLFAPSLFILNWHSCHVFDHLCASQNKAFHDEYVKIIVARINQNVMNSLPTICNLSTSIGNIIIHEESSQNQVSYQNVCISGPFLRLEIGS